MVMVMVRIALRRFSCPSSIMWICNDAKVGMVAMANQPPTGSYFQRGLLSWGKIIFGFDRPVIGQSHCNQPTQACQAMSSYGKSLL